MSAVSPLVREGRIIHLVLTFPGLAVATAPLADADDNRDRSKIYRGMAITVQGQVQFWHAPCPPITYPTRGDVMATPNEQDRNQADPVRRGSEQLSDELKGAGKGGTTGRSGDVPAPEEQADGDETTNPPRTTTGDMTAPKFGSAGSGGAELEPGPERP